MDHDDKRWTRTTTPWSMKWHEHLSQVDFSGTWDCACLWTPNPLIAKAPNSFSQACATRCSKEDRIIASATGNYCQPSVTNLPHLEHSKSPPCSICCIGRNCHGQYTLETADSTPRALALAQPSDDQEITGCATLALKAPTPILHLVSGFTADRDSRLVSG